MMFPGAAAAALGEKSHLCGTVPFRPPCTARSTRRSVVRATGIQAYFNSLGQYAAPCFLFEALSAVTTFGKQFVVR